MLDRWWSRSLVAADPLKSSFRSLARFVRDPNYFRPMQLLWGRVPFLHIARFSLPRIVPNSTLARLGWTGLGPSPIQFRLLPWVFGRIGVVCLLLLTMVRACHVGFGRVVAVGPVLVGPRSRMDLVSLVPIVWFVAGNRRCAADRFFVLGLLVVGLA